jgi:hypothetical protein
MCKKLHYVLSVILILGLAPKMDAQTDPGTTNLTHLWTFESGEPIDEVGSADGAYVGENIIIEEGDLITGPNASSVGDSYLELVANELGIADYPEISVVAWFTPDGAYNTNWNSVWYFGDSEDGANSSSGIALQARRGDNHARFWFTAGNPVGYTAGAEDGVNDDINGNYNNDELYHVVCTVNSNSELAMYYNGVFVDTSLLTTNALTGEIKTMADLSPNFGRFAHSC